MSFLVSVVIPVYNSEQSIALCLYSVLNQSYSPFEILVVNDGSMDNSLKEIERIQKEFPDKIVVINQQNQGVSAARNAGIKKSSGNLIAFLDSDDIWDSNKLEIQVKLFRKNPQIDFLGTNRDGKVINRFLHEKFDVLVPITPRMLMYKNFFMTSTILFRSEIMKSIDGFKTGMNHSEDWEFFMRICLRYNCYLYNRSTIESFDGKPAFGHSGLSANLWKMEKGELYALKIGRRGGAVSGIEYAVTILFSLIKYLRRYILTILRKT